jgi:cold shock CspA family protein
MPLGKIKRLVHLSQQKFLPNTRLVPDHNDKGYGVIEAQDGQEVFFPHEAVESRSGFEDVRRGQVVEYTLEAAPYLRAKWVKPPVNQAHNVAPWLLAKTPLVEPPAPPMP